MIDKDLKKIQNKMNKTISSMLYGGGGDPGDAELEAAAACFFVLKTLGLKIKNEKNIVTELSGENVHETNYIKGL